MPPIRYPLLLLVLLASCVPDARPRNPSESGAPDSGSTGVDGKDASTTSGLWDSAVPDASTSDETSLDSGVGAAYLDAGEQEGADATPDVSGSGDAASDTGGEAVADAGQDSADRESEGGARSMCPSSGWPSGWVCIPPGTFTMGSPLTEPGRDNLNDDEVQHQVTITRAFWMKATEVTQGEWQAVTGNNPSGFNACGANCPVEEVRWYEAVAYANALSRKDGYAPCYAKSPGVPYDDAAATAKITPDWVDGPSCPGYRLPTEAEWEYAARSG
ncbi:MAG TPA: formylglycine-generating enzyme family protein, partial [Polyangiaceae bacterium]|nr:formylglycine-generating enzyme family protein [Polyangiaceae bacterium]